MRRDGVATGLLLALERHDDLALAAILHSDVRMVVDSGDHSGGDLRGRARVGRALAELRTAHPGATLETASVNSGPGLVVREPGGAVVGVLGLGFAAGDPAGTRHAIVELWLCTAPAKLTHWNRTPVPPPTPPPPPITG